jgi:glyoxylase-like metal-dependent hydrolase (beta-lactamase superfamily II)
VSWGEAQPSKLGAQPVGETALVAEGVYQLKLPVPFPLAFISAYLIEGDDGWTLLDTGYDYPEGRVAWEAGARRAGLDLGRDVARIVVTHFHPDHLGSARWLQERSGAPVYMLKGEIEHSREVWEEPDPSAFSGHLIRGGMERAPAEKAAGDMRAGLALPEVMLPLWNREEITLGSGRARVVHVPGHADYQIALYDAGRKALFAADHMMLGITPNIGFWPDSKPQPLARYLASLKNLRGLPTDLVLPGHGPLFHGLDARIEELLRHHEERLNLMHGTLSKSCKTPFAVSRTVFRYTLSLYERCFALAETMAHLDHLTLQNRAQRLEEDGVVAYRAA